MQKITLKFIGESSMLVHSARGADPVHPDSIAHAALTGKRKKTQEDHFAIAHSEYMISFYEANSERVRIPSVNVKSSIVQGAKLHKLGSAFNRCVMILEDMVEVTHSGPKRPKDMWNDKSCVDARSVIVRGRVMRYRPKLNDWSMQFDLLFDETMIDRAQIVTASENAGKYIGIGDYRPEKSGTFGRFSVAVVEGERAA